MALAARTLGEKGFETKSSAPKPSPTILSSSDSRAETMITGAVLVSRNLRRKSRPSAPGRPRSRRRSAGLRFCALYDSLLGRERDDGVEALADQVGRDELGYVPIVLDDEYARGLAFRLASHILELYAPSAAGLHTTAMNG